MPWFLDWCARRCVGVQVIGCQESCVVQCILSLNVPVLLNGVQVRIQCEAGGRLVIAGEPEHPDNPWGVTAFRKVGGQCCFWVWRAAFCVDSTSCG